jgi:hypothetical protein
MVGGHEKNVTDLHQSGNVVTNAKKSHSTIDALFSRHGLDSGSERAVARHQEVYLISYATPD